MSPNATVGQTIGATHVTIHYSRPAVRGRQVFGDLQKYGEVWRLGANEATTVTFTHDVTIEGKPLKAGTYALMAIPNSDRWTIIVNSHANQWGAYAYKPEHDLLRVDVTPVSAPHQEQFSLSFEDITHTSATLNIRWHGVRVPVRIETNTAANVRALMTEKVASTKDGKEYYWFARQAYGSDFMIDEAIEWAKKSLEYEQSYDRLAIMARLQAKAGNYPEAVAYAERALKADMSKKTEPGVYPALDKLVVEWKMK